jgi:hypothetical protein
LYVVKTLHLQHFENTTKLPPLLELFNNEAVNHSLEKWRGMEKKCDFGQNCKNKALNTLTNCSKLTINHLRYQKPNSKELEIAEKYLILNRAGINIITSQYLNRHICEQHRDELGIYWTREKRTCPHPLHGDSKAKPDRGIDAVMSREIWLRLQLVAICEGNFQNHTSYICTQESDVLSIIRYRGTSKIAGQL